MRVISLLLTLLFISSSIYMTDMFNSIGLFIIYGFLLLIGLSFIIFKTKNFKINPTIFFVFSLFVLSTMFSALINSDLNLALGGVGLLGLYIVTGVVFPNIIKSERGLFIIKSILIGHIPLLLVPVILNGFDSEPYRGIFYNSNALGLVASTVFAVIVSYLMTHFEDGTIRNSRFKSLLAVSLALFSFILVLLSGSRTSFIASVLIVVLAFFTIFVLMVKQGKFKAFLRRSLSIAPIILMIYLVAQYFFPLHYYFERYILLKFVAKSGDILDGRGTVWTYTLSEAGLFGGGRGFFSQTAHAAHNTFISILGQYGWITLLLFYLFLLVSLVYFLKYLTSSEKYKFLPLIMLSTFVLLSMGEGMMFKLSMIGTFFCVGMVSVSAKESAVERKLEQTAT